MTTAYRTETDGLGLIELPEKAMYGAHTARALENFPLSGYGLPEVFIRAYAQVKQACARVNHALGHLPDNIFHAMNQACTEIILGEHQEQFCVDALQGGAGTSTNMNVNEVIANRAGQILGAASGTYAVHPLQHVNLHQSTNDTYPTALRIAVLHELHRLEQTITDLQGTLQHKEQMFGNVLRLARTQLQDAVPVTFGMTFGAWAEAIARDRWRIFKCRERIRQVNLGGTAVGTGLGAPRDYILRVTDELRAVTGLKLSRAENLVDATQNMDSFVEVSAMLKACAVNLFKISGDVRLLASGPRGGLSELRIPAVQAGSTIMPGKINPVIPEAVSQAALRVMSNDGLISQVAALGNLELNQFLPLLAHSLLESLNLLSGAISLLDRKCLHQAEPDAERCNKHVHQSDALATMLVAAIGYDQTERIVHLAHEKNLPVTEAAARLLGIPEHEVRALLAPARMRQLGFTEDTYSNLQKYKEKP